MNIRIASIVAALLAPIQAFGMTQSQIPSKFNIPWGNSASSSYIRTIPQNSQIGIVNCAASLTDGFPPLTFIPTAQGGCPPFGQDFNGILKQITQWNQWQAINGSLPWDSSFSTAVGGYPKGAIVQSNVLFGRLWLSTADNNTNNPDAATNVATNWIVLPGLTQPGTPIGSFTGAAPQQNMVLANGLTVGNASSNATNRANADTFWLFSFIWNNCNVCTLFNSAGGVISKGANPAADFNANDAIATINMSGTGIIGADSITGSTTTFLVNTPVVNGNRLQVMSTLGEDLHTLSLGETPSGIQVSSFITLSQNNMITVSGTVSVTSSSNVVTSSTGTVQHLGTGGGSFTFDAPVVNTMSIGAVTSSGSNSMSGLNGITVSGTPSMFSTNTSGGAHNIVQRSALVYWNLAL